MHALSARLRVQTVQGVLPVINQTDAQERLLKELLLDLSSADDGNACM